MRSPHGATDWFFNGDRNTNMPLVMNDLVCVREGEHAGREGVVAALISMRPEPRDLVEPTLPPLEAFEAPASNLFRVGGW